MTETSANLPDTVWKERELLIDRIPRSVGLASVMAVFLGTWWAVTASGLVSPIILPGPGETWAHLVEVGQNILSGGFVFDAFVITTITVLYAYVLAAAIGIFFGIVVGDTLFGEQSVLPYLVAIDTMPKVAFAPLFIAWLGFGISSKVALATFIATFPIIVATASGLRANSRDEILLFKSIGASRLQTLLSLKLPTGLPYLFTGLKIAAVGVMAGAITGEFLGGGKGMGALIRVAASQLDTPMVFALILYLSLLGLALYTFVGFLQKRIVFWKEASDGMA